MTHVHMQVRVSYRHRNDAHDAHDATTADDGTDPPAEKSSMHAHHQPIHPDVAAIGRRPVSA
ncbi:hypothetical protein [Georgenia yuyongxinii]